jgi:hypothetical protein
MSQRDGWRGRKWQCSCEWLVRGLAFNAWQSAGVTYSHEWDEELTSFSGVMPMKWASKMSSSRQLGVLLGMDHAILPMLFCTSEGVVANMRVATLDGGFSQYAKVLATEKTWTLSTATSPSLSHTRLATACGVSMVAGRPRRRKTVVGHLSRGFSISSLKIAEHSCLGMCWRSGWTT